MAVLKLEHVYKRYDNAEKKMFKQKVRSATVRNAVRFRAHSTRMNCNAPEMMVRLVSNPHTGAWDMPPFRASRIPAAIPIVV